MTLARRIVWESDTVGGRAFDLVIQALILASVVTFSIETLPNSSTGTRWALTVFESVSVVVFAAEYALRLITARDRALHD